MSQNSFDFPLTNFEQITLEAQVSYKAVADKDIERLMNSDKLKSEVKAMVNRWNDNRIKKGLRPYK
jgi:hypothetical protein